LIGTIAVFIKISDQILLNHIESSINPRREFWNFFRKDLIDRDLIEIIPGISVKMTMFEDKYTFYDKRIGNKKGMFRLQLTRESIYFRDACDIQINYSYDLIKDLQIKASIEKSDHGKTEDSLDIPKLVLEIKRKDKVITYCDLMNIDCEIDELEQIVKHFKKAIIDHQQNTLLINLQPLNR
jgi:hypothetical protein